MSEKFKISNLDLYYGDFHAFLDDVSHLAHHLKIQTNVLVACQRLAADLNEYPLIHWLLHRFAS